MTYDRQVGRWEPGARERLVVAAVDLFTDKGYDATTVAEIAQRAGVTRSTFFRHFPDKRELLVAGQETLSRLLAGGIADADADATPLQAVAAGLGRACGEMRPLDRQVGSRLTSAVAASTELQERDALKRVGLAAAITTALLDRGTAGPRARLAAELGVLALKEGYARWLADERGDEGLTAHALAALDELTDEAAALR